MNANKKRLYLLQLPISDSMYCLPQAVGSLWSYCEQFPEVTDNIDLIDVWWSESIQIQDPDIVAASCYLWNWKQTYEIIRNIKSRYPTCKIIVGGPEPQYQSEWCQKHPEIDAVVAYYGEETFRQILATGKLDGPGIVTAHQNRASEAVYAKPEDIPSPYLSGFFDRLLKDKPKNAIRSVFEGNRGCPYSCSFCDIGAAKYNKIQFFETDRCLSEIDWLIENKVRVIDVADSNFGIFPRDEQLVDYLVQKKQEGLFHGKFMPTWAKTHGPRIIKLASKLANNGIDNIFGLSLQSTNPEALKAVKRRNAYDIEGLKPIISDLNKNKVGTYTELIFPLPGDTLQSFKEGIHSILDMPVPFDMLQINSLSRLSNTEFNSDFPDLKWAYISGTAKPYENDVMDEICISTESMTKEDVFEGLFYSRSFIIPIYWYGLAKYAAEAHYKNKGNRSKFFIDLYHRLLNEPIFYDHKMSVKEHYFRAVNNGEHIGYEIIPNSGFFFTDTAYSHLFYYQNCFFDYHKQWHPEYLDEIIMNERDFKPIDSLNDWLKTIHVKGRFSESWKN